MSRPHVLEEAGRATTPSDVGAGTTKKKCRGSAEGVRLLRHDIHNELCRGVFLRPKARGLPRIRRL